MHGYAPTAKVDVDATHRYGQLVVHEQLKFSVAANEFICICGPSGCGKTTLLDMLAGILKPSQGHVLIDGIQANPKQQSISFVFQEPSTFPWLTVRENVATGLKINGARREEIEAKVGDIIRIVGLIGFEGYYPHQISGGMKQRVAIARAFATDADLILMDEPFVSLDQPTRERMQREVLDIWRHRKRTVIFVTHNLEEAVYLADRVLILSVKPARIVADLPVPLPHPRDPLSAEFTEIRSECVRLLHAPEGGDAPPFGSI
ncbi:MAG: ABC transporter ATP-binding protein [Hyphomonadaceae bacterium]|jgi:ABC-type nitrate/sulfonate/bicarbonate transport system ATPase subunit|nr:ABC transporter ATP-binding protein [Hyphomonadaceae bacterium]